MAIEERAIRLRVRCPAQINWEGGELPCLARDLSQSGMLLQIPSDAAEPFTPGLQITVACALPLGLGSLQAVARVAGQRPMLDDEGDDAVALAVELQDFDPEAASLDRLLSRGPTLVLAVGLEPATIGPIPGAELLGATAEQALAVLDERRVGVVVVGPGLAAEQARDFLARAVAALPRVEAVHVVFSADADLSIFQDLIDADQIFYLARAPASDDEVSAIVRAAVKHHLPPAEPDEESADRLQMVLGVATQVASQQGLADAGRVAARGVEGLVETSRAYCLVHDPATDTLWSKEDPERDERRESAAVGLTSFVIRTGEPLQVDRVGEDPRYDRDADDPAGRGDEQLLVVPVKTSEGQVLAVLVAVRAASAVAFSASDHESLQLLADQCASSFAQMALQEQLRARSSENSIFRQEAVDHHRLHGSGYGKVLELSPGWTRLTFWLLLALVGIGLLFLGINQTYEYAEGPAVVKIEGRTDLTALAPGTVISVAVQPGQRVSQGQLLVRFHDTSEADELERIRREFELQLINRLRDPTNAGARQALTNLHAQKKLAEARIAARTVCAPHAGVVGDIRIRPGQHVASGAALLSLAGDHAEHFIVAMIPGQYRPQMKRGMILRLELAGYERFFRELGIASIGDEVIGPQEAKRYLGPDSDALTPPGSVVLVRAPLRSSTFTSQGRTYAYHDGMNGVARVRVRAESILLTLIPGLKDLLRTADES